MGSARCQVGCEVVSDFKFIVGQEVKIKSGDRNLKGKVVKIVTRHTNSLSEDKNYNPEGPWYKVKADWIQGYLSFFEDQLE